MFLPAPPPPHFFPFHTYTHTHTDKQPSDEDIHTEEQPSTSRMMMGCRNREQPLSAKYGVMATCTHHHLSDRLVVVVVVRRFATHLSRTEPAFDLSYFSRFYLKSKVFQHFISLPYNCPRELFLYIFGNGGEEDGDAIQVLVMVMCGIFD